MLHSQERVSNLVKRTILKIELTPHEVDYLVSNLVKRTILKIESPALKSYNTSVT